MGQPDADIDFRGHNLPFGGSQPERAAVARLAKGRVDNPCRGGMIFAVSEIARVCLSFRPSTLGPRDRRPRLIEGQSEPSRPGALFGSGVAARPVLGLQVLAPAVNLAAANCRPRVHLRRDAWMVLLKSGARSRDPTIDPRPRRRGDRVDNARLSASEDRGTRFVPPSIGDDQA